MAKILAGGLPGGAVAGRKEILDHLDFERTAEAGKEKIVHPGTFNANPVSASAGLTALKIIETTDACDRANASAEWLRAGFNEVIEKEDVSWAAYGTFSGVHIFTNPKSSRVSPSSFKPDDIEYSVLKEKRADLVTKLRLAMAVNGVDLNNSPGAQLSATHTQDDLVYTVDAFRESLRMLKKDGEI